jgi:hypothetical protein
MNVSQFLLCAGLIFEFVSVAISIRKLFWGYYKRIEERTMTSTQRRNSDKKEGLLVLLFLCVGMLLQGLAIFV